MSDFKPFGDMTQEEFDERFPRIYGEEGEDYRIGQKRSVERNKKIKVFIEENRKKHYEKLGIDTNKTDEEGNYVLKNFTE